ncbi:hypothetical protein SK224_00200 [Microbacterium sp. BG28]|uniref:hypothetical protein n=1 Tax=Microbacterium sp. BG28 TaxID=3097356 RepID=UPI002A5AF725|nr:hypothetical protein [Microbacterium sp. BG28]MDY0827540.1 hypothetical protein [Microbacterium sp. BG28]
MISSHTYAATLLGAPDRALGCKGGRITLNDSAAPHVTATVDVPIPDAAVLGLLDPRIRRRVRIDATAVFAFGTQARSFDLGLRDRRVRHADAVVTLVLASDEAILEDYAPLADDSTPYQHQNSIRALTNYVLGKALPGVTLATGAPDAPIRALISSANLLSNPRARFALTGWSAGGGASLSRLATGGPAGAPTYVAAQSSSAGQLLVAYAEDNVKLDEGKRYRLSVAQNVDAGTTTAIDAVMFNASGQIVADLPEVPQVAPAGWFRRSIEFVAPAGVKQLWARSFTVGSVAAGRSLNTSAWRLSEVTDDPTDTGFFDDTTPTTTEYFYAANGTTSTRTALIDRAADLLTWRAGVNALAFLAPILQALGLRLVCDEARVFTLRDATYTAPGSLTIRHGVNLIDADDALTRDDSEFFDAAVVRYRWRDSTGTQRERVDSFALVTPPTQVRTIEKDTPYPGPGFAEYAVRRAQGRGRLVTVQAVADWNARAEQPTEYTLLGAPVQLGKTSRIDFDLSTDEMTVTSRTTDTVIGAIDLLPGTIDQLVGIIDAL